MASLRMVWGIGPALPEEVELSPEAEQDIALTLMGLKEQEFGHCGSLRYGKPERSQRMIRVPVSCNARMA